MSDPNAEFRDDVWAGLTADPKTLPCKYFYDARGSQLFEAICELPEYYPTRTELQIMRDHIAAIAARCGAHCHLIELGSGSSTKTRLLLDALRAERGPAEYTPVDISGAHLEATAVQLRTDYPGLSVVPVHADFTQPFQVPAPDAPVDRRVVYFPGSTIGNFTRARAVPFLTAMAQIAGPGGALLIGADLKKDPAVLEAAYDDAQGVTADFNCNLLDRINRELDGTFDRTAFRHRAHWNDADGRIEMYLDSLADQTVSVAGRDFEFAAGEAICTEHSHKYDLAGFAAMVGEAGWAVEQVWMDPAERFSVQWCVTK
ncbi:MAG: L-histidine N(alpha)-methyltransferase [Planctomycetota bacterium]